METASGLEAARLIDVGVWFRPAHRQGGPARLEGAVLETEGETRMGIVLGPVEAASLAMILTSTPTSRPLTHPFYASLLAAGGLRIARIVVTELTAETFQAAVFLHGVDAAVDARPSDALALAVLTGAPIFVAENVRRVSGVRRGEWKAAWISEHAEDVAKAGRDRFWRRAGGPVPGDVKPTSAPGASPATSSLLTKREEQVLRLVAAGHTNIEAGAALGLSPYTVTRHLANVYSKLGVSRRAQAVTFLRA